MYSQANKPRITNVPIAKVCDVRKSSARTSIALGLFLLFGSSKLITTITETKIRNMIPIRSRNGTSGIQALNPKPNGIVIRAATNAALAVARFQKKPNTNMATTPGEIIPVNSCTNWKPCSRLCSAGATKIAIPMATKITIRPIPTCLSSLASRLKYFL